MNQRTCVLCGESGNVSDLLKIQKQRYDTLKRWYPDQLNGPDDRVHKTCLANLGLHPFPSGRLDLERRIRTKLLNQIPEIAREHPNIRGPGQLIDVISKQLKSELHLPTENGCPQVRHIVSHYVTTKMFAGRGGLSTTEDSMGFDNEAVNLNVCLPDGMPVKEAVVPSDPFDVNAAMHLPIRQLTALTTLVNAVSKSTLAHKEMIDSETLLLREKRECATHSQSKRQCVSRNVGMAMPN